MNCSVFAFRRSLYHLATVQIPAYVICTSGICNRRQKWHKVAQGGTRWHNVGGARFMYLCNSQRFSRVETFSMRTGSRVCLQTVSPVQVAQIPNVVKRHINKGNIMGGGHVVWWVRVPMVLVTSQYPIWLVTCGGTSDYTHYHTSY